MPILDPTSLTTPRELLGLFAHMGTVAISDTRGATIRYHARALTPSVPMNSATLFSEDWEPPSSNSRTDTRQILRVKVVSNEYDNCDPHAFLADPCDRTIAADPDTAQGFIVMHTLAITQRNMQMGEFDFINEGDIVEILCRLTKDGKPNVQYATVTRIIERINTSEAPESAADVEQCAQIAGLFSASVTTRSLDSFSSGSTVDVEQRREKIDRFWRAVMTHGNVPSGVVITSTGRTIDQGRRMILRFALARSITINGDGLEPLENERLRGILTDRSGPYKLAIANPVTSNHCVGSGCANSRIIAFDVSGGEGSNGTDEEKVAALEAIGNALQLFKDDTGPTGYQALVDGGHISAFASTTFAPGGWKLEAPPRYSNNAVHIELANE
tara:strand:- start:5940 stop:7097 length:1158 start_codon:yes stop_codon:yes gene_type:complete